MSKPSDQPQEFCVRRLSSIFTSLALAAGAVAIASPAAQAATTGAATVKTSDIKAPSAVPNTQILKIVRLNKTNSFLVLGIDKTTAGANAHVWKMKEDLSVDTSFKAVDLGDDFEYPTASNSSCVTRNMGMCTRFQGFTVNETTGTFVVVVTRLITVNQSSFPIDGEINSIAVGNLSTGAISGRANLMGGSTSQNPLTDFAAYKVVDISKDACTSAFGSSYQGSALSSNRLETYSLIARPDGSVVLGLSCNYSTSNGTSTTEYQPSGFVALKPSGSTFVLDTSWGTNGVLKGFDDPTKCGYSYLGGAVDYSITSNTSTKLFSLVQVSTFSRVTTPPQGMTSYNGCSTSGTPPTTTELKLLAIKANGGILATNLLKTDDRIGRWIIDSKGQWNSASTTGSGSSATTEAVRLNTKGELDSTFGTNGRKTLTGVPSTITVNGTSVNMMYMFSGIATTATGNLFTGFSSSSTGPNFYTCRAGSYVTFEQTLYPYYMTFEKGLETSFGTNGLGEGVTTQMSSEDVCNGTNTAVQYINGKGQHSYLVVTRAIGAQTAGLKYVVWGAAAGVTSGGDGTGVIGGGTAGRVDKTVYSTRLPKTTQTDSALQVLSSRQARDLDIRTTTPRICVALTTSVLLVNPGRCVVRVIDEDTKKVIRTMTTIVKKTEVEDGTTLTTDEPIYFKQANTKLSKTALAQVKELAEASADAARVVVIGHSAALGDVSPYSYAISRDRANAVKAALIKAGVKAPIEVVALAYSQPEKTAKNEKAQALNRRAEVFIFPK